MKRADCDLPAETIFDFPGSLPCEGGGNDRVGRDSLIKPFLNLKDQALGFPSAWSRCYKFHIPAP